MLATDVLEILDVVLVCCRQQEITFVRQILQSSAVDELDHVFHCTKVNIRNEYFIALLFYHFVLEHCSKNRRSGTQNCLQTKMINNFLQEPSYLMTFQDPIFTLDGDIS